jgi:ABC-type transport system substrate-binding protein
MARNLRAPAATGALLVALLLAVTGFAQKPGGILQMPDFASPASMSIHEESTIAAVIPTMGVFNNLVVFDQHVAQNSVASIVPDLATGWSWSEDGTQLTFPLLKGVKWHDGRPFTAQDVKCTWEALLGVSADKFRINPRKAWYRNVEQITTNGDYQVTFQLKRPQPYLIALLASGQSPVYPCHVPLRDMRSHPIGTGPFDNIELRRAMALSLDRRAFIDILTEGQGAVGGSILPPPDGVWGMPPDVLHGLPGYGPDVQKNRAEARAIMQRLGYGPDKRLPVTVSTRNVEGYRDAAVIAISQLSDVHIDGQLELIETANWFPRVMRKGYTVGVTVAEGGLDEPDQKFYEAYVCGAERNYSGYCNQETDRLIDRQSMETDPQKRRKLVWEVERQLAEDASRPVLLYSRFATCMQPRLKGLTTMTNSRFNGWRMEDVWLDK